MYQKRDMRHLKPASHRDRESLSAGAMSRRGFIKRTSGGTACLFLGSTLGRASGGKADRSGLDLPADITQASATDMARAIRAKTISSSELVQLHIDQIKRVNSTLNAVVQLTEEQALERAREADATLARGESWGPLHGVPFTVKDLFDTEGIISTQGTLGLKSYVPSMNATVVTRLLQAGGVLLGKTNTPEYGMAWETDNFVYGRTNNPFAPDRTPGGSTGGESAIISAAGSPLGLGSDAAGSIRWPAHCAGITGIKPTTGRVPATGHGSAGLLCNAAFGLLAVGPMARFVRDLALTLPVLSGPDGRDPTVVPMPWPDPGQVQLHKLRVAFYVDNGIVTPTTEIRDIVTRAAASLTEAKAQVVEKRPPRVEQAADMYPEFGSLNFEEGIRRQLRRDETTTIHPLLEGHLEIARACNRKHGIRHDHIPPAALYSAIIDNKEQLFFLRAEMNMFMNDHDVIISPPNAYPAMRHGTSYERSHADAMSYAYVYNMVTWPAAVVRCGTSPEGLPIGVQIAARPWREDIVLAVAEYLERQFGGWTPPSLLATK